MNLPSFPNRKTSNYPWLGSFPAHWVVKRLRFATERIEQGWSPQCDNQAADDDAWGVMKVGCVNGDQFDASENKALPPELDPKTEYELRPGDVLISRANTRDLVGSAAIVPSDVRAKLLLCDKLFRIALSPEVDAAYLTFCLRTRAARYQYEQDATGASGSMQNIGQDAVKNLVLPFPSYSEQQQIAAFLDWKTSQIDALIAKKQTLLQKLKEKRLAVITQAVTKGLNPDAPMRDSGIAWLGNVPTSWEVKKLKFVGEAIIGLTYDPDDVSDHLDGTLVLRANNIQEGKLVASDPVYVNAEIPHKLKLLPLDILICSRNGSRRLIGKCGLVTESFVGCTFGAFNTVFRSDANSYIYYVLNSSLFEFQAGSYLTSTINQLTIGTLNSFVVPVPPIAEQNDIVESLWESGRSFEKMLDKVESAITRLTEYRSALITAATTGKIDVRNVAIPAHA